MSKRLTKIKFHSIARDLREGMAPADVAKKQGVSRETVRTVRVTKTWPGFVLHKQSKTSYITNAKAKKFATAQKAGLKPVDRAERQLAKDLKMSEQYISRDEFESALKLVNERLNTQYLRISTKADKRVWPWGRR